MAKERGISSSNRAKEIVAYKKLTEQDFDSAARLYEKAGNEKYANLIREYGPKIESERSRRSAWGTKSTSYKLMKQISPPLGAKYTSWWKMKNLQEDARIKNKFKYGWRGSRQERLIGIAEAEKKLGEALLLKGREKGARNHFQKAKSLEEEAAGGNIFLLIGAIISVLASFFLLTLNITGNVIGELSQNRSGSLGIILLILGILGFFAYTKR